VQFKDEAALNAALTACSSRQIRGVSPKTQLADPTFVVSGPATGATGSNSADWTGSTRSGRGGKGRGGRGDLKAGGGDVEARVVTEAARVARLKAPHPHLRRRRHQHRRPGATRRIERRSEGEERRAESGRSRCSAVVSRAMQPSLTPSRAMH
jgi:hypothetical protein